MSTVEKFQKLTQDRAQLEHSLATYRGQMSEVQVQIAAILSKHGVSSVDELVVLKQGLEKEAEQALKVMEEENSRVSEILQRLTTVMSELQNVEV